MGSTQSSDSGDDSKLLYTHIETIIKPYIELAREHPVQKRVVPVYILKGVNTEKKDEVPVLRLPAFVNLVNASLQSDTKFTLPYIQSIYNMAGMTNSCNGIITIRYLSMVQDEPDKKIFSKAKYNTQIKDSFKPYLFLKTRGKTEKVYIPITTIQNGIRMDKTKFYKSEKYIEQSGGKKYLYVPLSDYTNNVLQDSFISRFLVQYSDPYCKFISIALSLKSTECGHSNMLLIYKGKTTTYLMLYEPHGAEGVQSPKDYIALQYSDMTNSFIKFLTGVIQPIHKEIERGNERTVVVMSAYNVSEREGIQKFMKDKNGYCSMISSFWLYIILNLMKPNYELKEEQKEKLFLNLNYIETSLYNIVISKISEDKQSDPQGKFAEQYPYEVLYSIIVHFSYDFLTRFYMNYLVPNSPLYNIFVPELISIYTQDKVNKPTKFNELILARYTTDYRTNPSEEYLEQIKLNAIEEDEFESLKEEGAECFSHNQCKSKYCEGKCKNRDYNQIQSDSQESSGVSDFSQSSASQSSASQSEHSQSSASESGPSPSGPSGQCAATQEDDLDEGDYSQEAYMVNRIQASQSEKLHEKPDIASKPSKTRRI